MSLKTKISDDMKDAMRAGDTKRRDALRLVMAAIKQREVDERIEMDDANVVAAIEKMLKQRKDSIAQYQAAGRQDLADQEIYEADLLRTYMPQALSDAEVEAAVAGAIAKLGAAGIKDMGKVMAELKLQLAGRADMGKVSALIKAKLTA